MNVKWKERKVLVTGANGFVGSHLVDRLVEKGADVTAFVNASSSSGHRNLTAVEEDIDIFRGDLRDPFSTRQSLEQVVGHEPVIFHLGAQARVGESWDRPYETVETNVIGTLNLLQGIVDLDMDIYKFDNAGTSEQFGNADKEREENCSGELVLDESSTINPKSVYATSKVAADFLSQNYHDAYGLPTVTTRMFNNYGPRQNPRDITGTIITQALEREKVELGNLKPKRDMCYVADGVKGHIDVASEGKPGELYTYGYGESISMREWAEKIISLGKEENYWKKAEIVQDKERYRPGNTDVKELKVDYSKINNLSGWKPGVSWEEGIKKTIKWYSNNRDRWYSKVDWK